MAAQISRHFRSRNPSAIRKAQILFSERADAESVQAVNVAIGNVSLPMHPAMQARMRSLGAPGSPFADGVVKYTASVGTAEARAAFLNVLGSSGIDTAGQGLRCVVTDGGSQAMELMVLGVCGPGGERPLMLLDPAYTNYMDLARRVATTTVSVRRELGEGGRFAAPDPALVERQILEHRPTALVVIPADNPTGQFLGQQELVALARLCVRNDMWIVSDEAYRQLHYSGEPVSSVWRITEDEVPGITGCRISIESSSKVWNACGLRIGALVTDNAEFHARTVAEYTANLCANAIGQYIFGAVADIPHEELRSWYEQQRSYYSGMMQEVCGALESELPGLIVSRPEAALYSVVDVRDLVAPEGFDAAAFVAYCAQEGRVTLEGGEFTLLVAPMGGFYGSVSGSKDSSRTQMRIAYVEPPARMRIVPVLFAELFRRYVGR